MISVKKSFSIMLGAAVVSNADNKIRGHSFLVMESSTTNPVLQTKDVELSESSND